MLAAVQAEAIMQPLQTAATVAVEKERHHQSMLKQDYKTRVAVVAGRLTPPAIEQPELADRESLS
jgi:hypothetical protein